MTDSKNINDNVARNTASNAEDEMLQNSVRAAFDAVHVPEEVYAKTVAAIEAQRLKTQSVLASSDPVSCERVPLAPSTVSPASPKASSEPSASSVSSTVPPSPSTKVIRARFSRKARRIFAAAACVVVLGIGALGAFGAYVYNQPQAYIGVDINPSLELSVNTFDRVIDVQAFNSDAEVVLETVNLSNKEYGQALNELLAAQREAGYLTDASYVEVSVTTEDDKLASRLEGQSTQCLQDYECESTCNRVDEQTREEAHDAGMGVGRYNAAQQLIALDENVTLEDCAHMSMREIHDRIAECEGETAHYSNGQGAGEQSGMQSGYGSGLSNQSGETSMKHGNGNKQGNAGSESGAMHHNSRSVAEN